MFFGTAKINIHVDGARESEVLILFEIGMFVVIPRRGFFDPFEVTKES
jgi:hypothetical protein